MSEREYLERQHPSGLGGHQRVYQFPNGYLASCVRGWWSFAGLDGRWELAVIAGEGAAVHVCYATPITKGLIGHLTDEARDRVLDDIAALPPYTDCDCKKQIEAKYDRLRMRGRHPRPPEAKETA